MSGILRRILALILGIAIGVAGGAVWANQSLKPMQMLEDAGVVQDPPLKDQNVEELVELIAKLANNPDEYTFARLEKEYGLDLKKILQNAGINTDNASVEDMNALQNVSLLSILNGAEALLDNIKLRALYVIIPSVVGKDLDEIISREAQEQMGDYTLWQLLNSDAETQEPGLITALKALKIGSLLPSVFDAVYNESKHEYTYTVKQDSGLDILNLIADIPLKAITDLKDGEDPIRSIMEGELRVLGDKSLTEILDCLFSVLGKESRENLARYIRVLGDAKLSDLFEYSGDKYKFTFTKVVEDIELGYILGFERDDDGVWYKDKEMTEPVDGLLEMLANLDLKAIMNADGDTLKTVEAVIGDMSVLTLYETFVDGDRIPAFIKALGDMTVSDILRNGAENIRYALVENLNMYIGDWTLGQALDDVLSFEDKQKVADSAALSGLMRIRLGDLLKEEYTLDTFLDAIDNAMGELEFGALFGKEKADGKWQDTNAVLGVFFDITIGDVIDTLRADNFTEGVKALFGSITIGDFYGAAFGFTSSDSDPVYHKDGRYVTEGFNDFLNLELWKLLVKFDKNSDYDIMNDVRKLTVGDVVYSGLVTFRNIDRFFVLDNGEVALNNEQYGSFTKPFLNETFANYKANKLNGQWWLDKFYEGYDSLSSTKSKYVILGGVGLGVGGLYFLDNDFLVNTVTKMFGSDVTWFDLVGRAVSYTEVDGRYVGGRFYNSFMDKFLHDNAVDTLTKGYPLLHNYKDYITLGNLLTLTESVANKFEKILNREFIVSEDGTPTIGGDLINLADTVLDIPVSSVLKRVDGKITVSVPEEINDLMLGDVFAFYANKKSTTGFKATLSEDRRVWSVESEKLEIIYNNLFNLTIGEVRVKKAQIFRDVLGDTLLSELVNEFDTSWQSDPFLTKLYDVKAVDFFELMDGNALLKDVYGDVTLEECLGGYFSENALDDTVISATMKLTVGQIADLFSSSSKKQAFKALVFDLYRNLYIRDFVNAAAKIANMDVDAFIEKLPAGKKLINKIFDYNIGYFEHSTKAQIKEALNNLYVGDVVAELAVKLDNRFNWLHHEVTENADGTYSVAGDFAVLTGKLYNLSFGELYQMTLNKTELRDYIYTFRVGDFISDFARKGYNYIMKSFGESRHNVDYADGEYVVTGDFAVLGEKIYNLSLQEAYSMLKDRAKLVDYLYTLKLGDFASDIASKAYNFITKRFEGSYHNVSYVEGVYSVDGDFEALGENIYNLSLGKVYSMLKNKSELKEYCYTLKLGDFGADIVRKFYNKLTVNFGENRHQVQYENGEYFVTGDFEALAERFYNLSFSEIYTMLRDRAELRSFIGSFKVGDFTADLGNILIDKFLAKFNRRHSASYVDGVYRVEGAMAELFEDIYNLTGSDLLDFYRHPMSIFDKFDKPLGSYARYGAAVLKWLDPDRFDITITKNADGTYTAEGNYADVFKSFINISLKEFINNLKTDKFAYLKGAILSQIRVGNVFRRGQLTFDEEREVWLDAQGNELEFGSGIKNLIMKNLYNLPITQLQNLNVDELMEGVYIGDVAGYVCNNRTQPHHTHDDTCIWMSLKTVYREGDYTRTIRRYMPLDVHEALIAGTSLESIIDDGLSFKSLLSDAKLGDLLGLYFDGLDWYEYKEVNGLRVIDANNNYVIGEKSSELEQAMCGILADDLLEGGGVQTIIDSLNDVKLGYVMGYTYSEESERWLNGNKYIDNAMNKMSSYTVEEVRNNFRDIISNEFTFADLLDEKTLESNIIFKSLGNTTLSHASRTMYNLKIGTLMGYEQVGDNWYRNGEKVDDEVMLILADYCYGQFANVSGYELYDENGNQVMFVEHLMDKMTKNLTIDMLYPDAGKADANGFDALLDPTWKLNELPDKLMNKIHDECTIEQLIKLGVFGDYFALNEGETVLTATGEHFVTMDKVFERLGDAQTDGQARAYWSQLTMPEYMAELMGFVAKIEESSTVKDFIELGVFGDFFKLGAGETLETATGENFEKMDTLYGILNPDAEDIRAYWLNMDMSQFMNSFISLADKLEELESKYEQLQKDFDEYKNAHA